MIGRLVLAVVLGLGLLLEIAVTVSARPPLPLGLLTVVATAAVCLAALLRRRHPAAAVAVAAGLILAVELAGAAFAGADAAGDTDTTEPAPIACLAMLIAVGTAVRRLRLGGAVLAWAGGALPALVAQALYSSTVALVMLIGWGAAVGAGAWLRVGDARRRSLRETVRRAERVALARDLHDVAAHHLTALIIQAQAGQVGAGDARAVLGEIETAGVEALDSLRRLARLLRDEDETPAAPGTVADLVAAFGRRGLLEADLAAPDAPHPPPGTTANRTDAATLDAAGPDTADLRAAGPDAEMSSGAGRMEVRLDLPDGPQPGDWPPEVATGVYRIAQEALTNVARHARDARHVTVTLAHDTRSIRLTVTDDADPAGPDGTHRPGPPACAEEESDGTRLGWVGRVAPTPDGAVAGIPDREGDGSPPTRPDLDGPASGHGVHGMRERAAALGGTLAAGPTARGWAVRAVIPAPPPRGRPASPSDRRGAAPPSAGDPVSPAHALSPSPALAVLSWWRIWR